jgi:hypothetical protein
MSSTRCAPFWAESPSILWKDLGDFFPFSDEARHCSSNALNSFTRFGLYLGVLLAVLYRSGAYLGLALGFAIISVAAYYGMKSTGTLREGFEITPVTPTLVAGEEETHLVGGIHVANKPIADVVGIQDRTLPTGPNPFMNVLVNEVLDNPTRGPAKSIQTPEAQRELSDLFQTKMYGDPTDVFQHSQDQRVWAVQPATSIPNDQGSFANWLYRVPGRTCKEGNNGACFSGTEGGVVTWLSAP